MRFRIVYEKARRNYSAYSPDLPGCVAAADTLEETKRLMREAIAFHLEGMAKDGDVRPEPSEFEETVVS
jgi:predicted RNase H-like HicB family nuclease